MVYRRLVDCVFALAAAAVSLEAQSVKLNGPLAQPGAGDVTAYAIDASGERVVYRADQTVDDQFELFGAPADGSAPAVRLCGTLPSGGDVTSFALAAGNRVVYLADENADEVFELFSVPTDGSASPVLLSGPLVAGGDVQDFRLTPDGTSVVFRANKLASGQSEIFAVPADGGSAPIQLDPIHRSVQGFWIAPDGSYVLFDVQLGTVAHLYRVPIDASQLPLELADTGPGNPQIAYVRFTEPKWDAGGEYVACASVGLEFDEDYDNRLFAIDVDASAAPVLLQSSPYTFYVYAPAGERVLHGDEFFSGLYSIGADGSDPRTIDLDTYAFVVSPDATRVAFVSGGRLYSSPPDGQEPPLELAGPGVWYDIAVSPNSDFVVYRATDATTAFQGLWVVPIGGGAPLLMNGPTVPGGRGAASFAIAPSGNRILYREDRAQDEVFELWCVDALLHAVKLSGELGGSRDVTSFQFSGNSQHVAYLADQNNDETFEVFGAPSNGSVSAVQYNDPLAGGPVEGDVTGFRPTPDGEGAIYRADQDANETFDLYAVNVDAPGETVRLSTPTTESGDALEDVAFTPTGDRMFFQLDGFRFYYLYSVPVDGSAPPVEIDHFDYEFGFPFTVTADGSRLVYRKREFVFGSYRLCSAPVEGGPVTDLAVLPTPRTVAEFQLTPDGSVAVYRADQAHTTVNEIFSIPVDGSAPAVRLNLPLSGERDVTAYAITPDGARVVYLADQTLDERYELWSVPVAGGRPDRVSGPLASTGDVTGFRLTANGAWAVFRADPESDGRFELFRAPAAGRRPPALGPNGFHIDDLVRLTPLVDGQSIETDFVIGPDDGNVFFRADAAADGVIEVFRAPLDGSGSLVKLSADPVTGGDVSSFTLAPDGSHVVYMADARTDGVIEIFGVPALGGVAFAYDTIPSFGDVISFQIAPDSGHVGWLVDRNVNAVNELFLAPLDGSQPAVAVNAPLATGRKVEGDYVLLTGGRALYRADQEANDVVELFLGSLPEGRTTRVHAPSRARMRAALRHQED